MGSARRQNSSRSVNPRLIVVGIVGILLVIALVFGISSCVRGCTSSRTQQAEQEEAQVNPDDDRVAYGVTSEQTARISEVLDRNESFAKIAKNADKIADERLIDLAISEPEAIDFVAGSIKADGSTQPYGDAVKTGEFPRIYTFDARWGYMPYGDSVLGVAGSGPVSLSMASMGLSGSTSYDPATIAQAVASANLDNGTSGMDDSFVSGHAAEAGLVATSVEASSDGIYSPVSEGLPVIIRLKSDSGIGDSHAHWALITALNPDNSITLYDPTSVAASTHSWSLGAVSSRTDAAFSLTADTSTAQTTTDTTDAATTADTTTADTTTAGAASTATETASNAATAAASATN